MLSSKKQKQKQFNRLENRHQKKDFHLAAVKMSLHSVSALISAASLAGLSQPISSQQSPSKCCGFSGITTWGPML
jgi:hypothetical protein